MNRTFTLKQGRSRAIMAGVCSIVFAATLSAQVTSVKLPTADSSASFQVRDSGSVVKLRVNGDGGFVAGGTLGTGTIPASGDGVRMMWYPAKAAFRAGYALSAAWDDANVGLYSMALGYVSTARGNNSIAMGSINTASARNSTAIGSNNTASGQYSTAIGNNNISTSDYSTAIGYQDSATGYYTTAIGYSTRTAGIYSLAIGCNSAAHGSYSTAMGYIATATGTGAIAMGFNTMASGMYSTAMGNNVSTNNFQGSFIIGDYLSSLTNSSAANEMTMRFAGGYRLFSNNLATIGVSLAAGGNSWGTISDSTKKTGFKKADHEYFLSSLSKLRLGSWNYKAQNADAKNYRHYGPMAQEIYHYFGHDGKGTIGCDTLLASADMDGIMMICLQALEKRTAELNKAQAKIAHLQSSFDEMKAEMMSMKNELRSLAAARVDKSNEKIALNTISKGQ
jgi:hypothetical protein